MARAREERRRASAKRRVETHDSGGGSKYIRLPEGYSFMQIKAGKYRLDFMSYEVKKGKGDQGGNPYFEKGELAFERTFFVHRGIGPNQDWHLCAAKTFGEPCPICEYRAKQARDPNADEEVLKELAPKERQIWLVKDLADPDNMHMMEASYHLFGKALDAKIAAGDEDDGYEFFADPVDGLTVRVNFEQSDRGKWVEATDIEFRPRREKYDADIVEEMPDLDSMLIATPYDKLKQIFLQTGESEAEVEDDEDEKPAKKKSKPAAKEVATAGDAGLEEGDRVYYSGGVCEIVRISKDGTSLTLEDSDGDTHKAVGVDEVKKQDEKKSKPKPVPAKKAKPIDDDEDEEEDDEDEADDEEEEEEEVKKPAPKKKAPAKKAKPVVEEDEDEDEEEDEEEDPAPKKGKAKPKTKKAKDDDDEWDDWD